MFYHLDRKRDFEDLYWYNIGTAPILYIIGTAPIL